MTLIDKILADKAMEFVYSQAKVTKVPAKETEGIISRLKSWKEKAYPIGEIVKKATSRENPIVYE